jgi:Glycosyl transferases group 1
MKQRLIFIDHSFHQTTHSSDFLRTVLSETFEIHSVWDESWKGGPSISADEINQYDYAFYLQVMSPLSELKKIRIPITWAPMYDGEKFEYARWKLLSKFDIKILSFSKKISLWSARFGMPVLDVQYYYLPPQRAIGASGNNVLFWYRGGISFEQVLKLFDPATIDSFVLLERPDGKNPPLSIAPETVSAYKINHIQADFLPREQYLELLKRCSIFVTPRKKEGIGAFTEALAMGKCVIAYDDATHNEYITHGVDGLLFNESTGVLDLSHVSELGEAAYQRAARADERWRNDKDHISTFIKTKRQVTPTSLWWWRTLLELSSIARKARYYAKRVLTH